MSMMDTTSLIGGAQNAYSVGVQGQAVNAATAQSNKKANGLDEKGARTAADNFESFFVGQMLEYMTQGVEVDPEFGGGHAEDMWRSMMNQEYGKHIVKSGGLGISKQVMDSLLKAQEESTTAQQKLAALSPDDETAGATNAASAISAAARLRQ